MNDIASRTGWQLQAGDTVRRRDYGATEYTVLYVFRGYYGGGMLAVIRHPEGTQCTVPAGSVFTF